MQSFVAPTLDRKVRRCYYSLLPWKEILGSFWIWNCLLNIASICLVDVRIEIFMDRVQNSPSIFSKQANMPTHISLPAVMWR